MGTDAEKVFGKKAVAQAPVPPKSDKQTLLEIALRMVAVARSIPTPGVSDSFLHSKTLSQDADTLAKIAGKM